jgi:hypothetical protein
MDIFRIRQLENEIQDLDYTLDNQPKLIANNENAISIIYALKRRRERVHREWIDTIYLDVGGGH